MASLTDVANGNAANAADVQQVIDLLKGTASKGVAVSMTAVNDAVNFALAVKNNDAGASKGLIVYNSAGTVMLQVDKNGVIASPDGTIAAGQLATVTGTQTLTNKTLTAPHMTSPVVDSGQLWVTGTISATGTVTATGGLIVGGGTAISTPAGNLLLTPTADLYLRAGSGSVHIADSPVLPTTIGGALAVTGTWTLNGAAGSFFGATAANRQTITGSRGGNAALAVLLTGLANLGLITDSTTA